MRFIFLFLTVPLFGDDSVPFSDFAMEAANGKTYNYWGEFINMLLTLILVLGLIFISVWALKRIMRTRIQHLNRCTGIKILERRALNPKSSLYLVTILGKGVVISESPAGIQLITEFSEKTDIENLLEVVQEKEDERPPRTFGLAKTLRKIVGRNA